MQIKTTLTPTLTPFTFFSITAIAAPLGGETPLIKGNKVYGRIQDKPDMFYPDGTPKIFDVVGGTPGGQFPRHMPQGFGQPACFMC